MKIFHFAWLFANPCICDWFKLQNTRHDKKPHDHLRSDDPGPRYFATTWSARNGEIWLAGGHVDYQYRKNAQNKSDLWRFDSKNLTWHTSTQLSSQTTFVGLSARFGAASCGVQDLVFIVYGGQSIDSSEILDDTWLYDIPVNQWIPLELKRNVKITKPSARAFPTAWCTRGRLIIFGGVDKHGTMLNDIWEFSLNDLQWIKRTPNNALDEGSMVESHNVPNSPTARTGAASWVVNSTDLYMFGGSLSQLPIDPSSISSDQLVGDMWILNLNTFQWRKLVLDASVKQPSARFGGFVGIRDNHLHLFGGYGISSKGLSFLDDFWMFSSETVKWTELHTNNSIKFVANEPDNSNLYQIPSARCCGSTWSHEGVLYIFGGLSTDAQPVSDLYLETNDQMKLDMLGFHVESYAERFLRELPPTTIFLICLCSFFSITCVFFAFLFIRKMVEYYPRHRPKSSKYMARYSRVDDIENLSENLLGNNNDNDLEMDPV